MVVGSEEAGRRQRNEYTQILGRPRRRCQRTGRHTLNTCIQRINTMKTPALRVLPLAALTLLLWVSPASAGDVTVFVTYPSPSEPWNRGYGAALSTTWFQAVNLEGEAARIPGALGDSNMTSFTGSALLAPP